MRTIKFKALAEGMRPGFSPKQWVEGSLILDDIDNPSEGAIRRTQGKGVLTIDLSTVCQYSGEIDGDKNELFEGDVLRGTDVDFDGPDWYGVCVFYRGRFGIAEGDGDAPVVFPLEEIIEKIEASELYFNGVYDHSNTLGMTVVGNVYDPNFTIPVA